MFKVHGPKSIDTRNTEAKTPKNTILNDAFRPPQKRISSFKVYLG
jgi:hypothetical protein